MMFRSKSKVLTALSAVGFATTAAAMNGFDFGLFRDNQLEAHSLQVFGVVQGVPESSNLSITASEANANPAALVTLARGLRAYVVGTGSSAAPVIDMMALWPNDEAPTHLIACNEEGTGRPGLQRIRLFDGHVDTIVTGTSSCDPVRRTAWGTIIFGEEVGVTGWVSELINPLDTTNVSFNRGAGTFSGGTGASNLTVRPALGHVAFEGLALYPNGVLYYGDENRPLNGAGGGAFFKFIPATPFAGGAPISSLSQSPLASGTVYGLRLGRRSGNTDYGQGSNTGLGTWLLITPSNGVDLRVAAAALKLTGYYRPEDLEVDPQELANGRVKFCGANTGNEAQDKNWGEVVCITDGMVGESLANTATPELQYLVLGNAQLAMPDNLAYQPGRGNWIIHEDGDGPEVGRNNDLWSCAPDGDDDDTLSDGCIRIGTLNDLTAEWTGGIFNRAGNLFFVSVQHNVTGHGVIVVITGWR
jgi:hypothetical protein